MGCGAFFPKGNFFFFGWGIRPRPWAGPSHHGSNHSLSLSLSLSQLFYFGILNLTCASSAYSYSVRILTAIKKSSDLTDV